MDTEMTLVDTIHAAELSDTQPPDSDLSATSDASSSSSKSLIIPLPRVFPFVTLLDRGDLAHRQAIAEIWIDYLPARSLCCFNSITTWLSPQAPDCYVKWTCYWVLTNSPLSNHHSPALILDISPGYPTRHRKEWTYWLIMEPYHRLTELQRATRAVRRASKEECNLIRSKRLDAWAQEAKALADVVG
ncbi:hypothetical protein K438DRAFT_2028942 [Mycena galopus ATCC 62051]|nr:hypothetical protein K438DRAFT_2028942 [Mycena galopus ATCC 62051]